MSHTSAWITRLLFLFGGCWFCVNTYDMGWPGVIVISVIAAVWGITSFVEDVF